jgi:hypothetical protein
MYDMVADMVPGWDTRCRATNLHKALHNSPKASEEQGTNDRERRNKPLRYSVFKPSTAQPRGLLVAVNDV